MTSRRRGAVTSKVHRTDPLAWADDAACKGIKDFLDWTLPNTDPICRDCPVRRDCHKAGLTPRQIGAMP